MPGLLRRLLCLATVMIFLTSSSLAQSPFQEAAEGFFASAFSSEYGDKDRTTLVRWETPLSVFVDGTPTAADLAVLKNLFLELKENVENLPAIAFTTVVEEANVRFSFVPLKGMGKAVAGYEKGNWGFMTCYHQNGIISSGEAAVVCDKTTQEQRNHLIQEEFINMLGLCNDIDTSPQSIIFDGWSASQSLAPLDFEMLSLLYSRSLSPGMTMENARDILTAAS